MKSLDGKVIAITGAGSGIGRALAVQAAASGARLALSDLSAAGLAETADLARTAGARAVAQQVLDVSDREAMHAWAEATAAEFGAVHVIVNNAGVALTGDLTDLEYPDLEWIVGINFWGVVHGTKAFLPHLIASGDGHLVTISSLFGLLAVPGQSAYNATKFAVRGLTEAVREEMLVARHRVGVSVVHPGGIKTAIARSGRAAAGQSAAELAKTFDDKLARTTPEAAARTIWKGVRRNRPRILIGADAHLLHNWARFTGSRYEDVVATLTRRTNLHRG